MAVRAGEKDSDTAWKDTVGKKDGRNSVWAVIQLNHVSRTPDK